MKDKSHKNKVFAADANVACNKLMELAKRSSFAAPKLDICAIPYAKFVTAFPSLRQVMFETKIGTKFTFLQTNKSESFWVFVEDIIHAYLWAASVAAPTRSCISNRFDELRRSNTTKVDISVEKRSLTKNKTSIKQEEINTIIKKKVFEVAGVIKSRLVYCNYAFEKFTFEDGDGYITVNTTNRNINIWTKGGPYSSDWPEKDEDLIKLVSVLLAACFFAILLKDNNDSKWYTRYLGPAIDLMWNDLSLDLAPVPPPVEEKPKLKPKDDMEALFFNVINEIPRIFDFDYKTVRYPAYAYDLKEFK